ncbi:O-antigen ligase family protein [Thalassobellus sediminis]|uniref:O-antigen ligase family protein n=1 Tax=Thalassobellus sediminis TaxID=3367753 RepID=UPI0037B41BC3
MNVLNRIKDFINTQEFLAYLISLVLSTLFLGYVINSVALFVFIIFSLRHFIIYRSKIKFDFTLYLPILIYLLFFFTYFWSVNQNQTKTGLERTIALFLVPLTFIIIPKFSIKNFKIVLKFFTITNTILGLFFLITAVFNYFNTKSISAFSYHELVSVLDLNAIYVSVAFSISLFYLLSDKKSGRINKAMILLFIALLFLLSSKTMVLILVVGLIVYFSLNKIKKIKKYKLILITIITFLFLGISCISISKRFLFEKETKFSEVLNKEKFGKVYLWTGSSIRILQLRILKEQVKEESIFWKGFGLFASRDNIKKRHLLFNTYPEFHDYNYHNQYAQIFSETGIFGLILLIFMLIYSLVKAFKTKRFLFLMFFITISLIFLTESFLWRQKGLYLFIMLYCLINRVKLESK